MLISGRQFLDWDGQEVIMHQFCFRIIMFLSLGIHMLLVKQKYGHRRINMSWQQENFNQKFPRDGATELKLVRLKRRY